MANAITLNKRSLADAARQVATDPTHQHYLQLSAVALACARRLKSPARK